MTGPNKLSGASLDAKLYKTMVRSERDERRSRDLVECRRQPGSDG